MRAPKASRSQHAADLPACMHHSPIPACAQRCHECTVVFAWCMSEPYEPRDAGGQGGRGGGGQRACCLPHSVQDLGLCQCAGGQGGRGGGGQRARGGGGARVRRGAHRRAGDRAGRPARPPCRRRPRCAPLYSHSRLLRMAPLQRVASPPRCWETCVHQPLMLMAGAASTEAVNCCCATTRGCQSSCV